MALASRSGRPLAAPSPTATRLVILTKMVMRAGCARDQRVDRAGALQFEEPVQRGPGHRFRSSPSTRCSLRRAKLASSPAVTKLVPQPLGRGNRQRAQAPFGECLGKLGAQHVEQRDNVGRAPAVELRDPGCRRRVAFERMQAVPLRFNLRLALRRQRARAPSRRRSRCPTTQDGVWAGTGTARALRRWGRARDPIAFLAVSYPPWRCAPRCLPDRNIVSVSNLLTANQAV